MNSKPCGCVVAPPQPEELSWLKLGLVDLDLIMGQESSACDF